MAIGWWSAAPRLVEQRAAVGAGLYGFEESGAPNSPKRESVANGAFMAMRQLKMDFTNTTVFGSES